MAKRAERLAVFHPEFRQDLRYWVETNRRVALRGFSWIVSPFEGGGVVIALELSLGAVIAGPFDIVERDLSTMIQRVIAAERAAMPNANSSVVH